MESAIQKENCELEQIIERMQSLRASGYVHVVELQEDAKRLVDWKEYVRSKPILSVAAASLVGFLLMKQTAHAVTKSTTIATLKDRGSGKGSFQSSLSSSIGTLATNVISSAIKNYIATMLQRGNSEGDVNDRFHHNTSKN